MTKKEIWENKKEIWEKYKTRNEWNDGYYNCDICGNNTSYQIRIGDYFICKKCFVGNELFIENKEPPNTSKEYIQKICDSAYEEDKEAIDEAIKYLGGK